MSSGFISEVEIAEKRRIRQEEWEKVRKPDQPLEVPEEEYDHRSLFERLQEQKQRKDFEFEESHRLKHMIKGLDDDEVEFLDLVDRSKLEEERKKLLEEAVEMADFRNKVACLQEQSLEQRIQHEIKGKLAPQPTHSGRTSQTKLLAGAVVKKRAAETQNTSPKRQKCMTETENKSIEDQKNEPEVKNKPKKYLKVVTTRLKRRMLPGLTFYEHSSDSASSDSDCDDESDSEYDLLGRRIAHRHHGFSALL